MDWFEIRRRLALLAEIYIVLASILPTMVRASMPVQVLLAGVASAALFPDCERGPLSNNTVCNTSASVTERAQALVAVLTNEEKFNLTGSTSPGVPRLGLPSYVWWSK